jgi:hypothetical protein
MYQGFALCSTGAKSDLRVFACLCADKVAQWIVLGSESEQWAAKY